jgi:hypothetical protein
MAAFELTPNGYAQAFTAATSAGTSPPAVTAQMAAITRVFLESGPPLGLLPRIDPVFVQAKVGAFG